MRVGAPVRVSTDEQAEKGNSLTEQTERLTAYCVSQGWNPPVFFVDDGYSAKNLNRPGIKALLERVKKKEFDVVLTTKIDRLSRNLLDLLQTVKMLDEYDCIYVSSSEKFDTSTAVGRMTLQLLGTFAEFERERTSERVKDNMMSLAKNTDRVLTKPCFGFDVVDKKIEINEAEAKDVDYMFELGENGSGHRMIAMLLNSRESRTKKGELWNQTNVKRLMQNVALTGTVVYNKRQSKNGKITFRDKKDWIIKENNHPAIITLERFNRVHEIFHSRTPAKKYADSETYLLTGIIKCAHCGGNMKGMTSRHKSGYKDYVYYRYFCSTYSKGYGCKHHSIHRDDLEKLIIEEVNTMAKNSSLNINIKVAASHTLDLELKEIQAQLNKVDKRIQKQIEAYSDEIITKQDLKAASDRAENERNVLNLKYEKLKSKHGSASDVKENAINLLDDITGVDRLKAKAALRLLIDRVDINDGLLVSVIWKP